jgi:hypothetical protein
MMVWVHQNDDGSTELVGYEKGLKVVARMVESGDDWTITSKSGDTYKMKGAGCPDPIDFIFKLISPRAKDEATDDVPFLRFKNHKSGECWEIWGVQ